MNGITLFGIEIEEVLVVVLDEVSDTLDGNQNYIKFKFKVQKKKKLSLIISGNNHVSGEIIFFINHIVLENLP